MPIRWDAVELKQQMDEVEAVLDQMEPIFLKGLHIVLQAQMIPQLPGYVDQPLCVLADEFRNRLQGMRSRMKRVADSIPKEAIDSQKQAANQRKLDL